MDWMEIGRQNDGGGKARAVLVLGFVVALCLLATMALPLVIPRGRGGEQGAVEDQTTQTGTNADDASIADATARINLDSAELLSGLTVDQVSSFSSGLARWMESKGIDPKTPIKVTKEPTTKGGATVVRVTVGDDPVECAWRDGAWSFNLSSEVNGQAEIDANTAAADPLLTGEIGVFDTDGLSGLLGKECAEALLEKWAPYATEHGLAGSYDSVVDLTTIKADEKQVAFTVVSPKATPEGYGTDLVNVTYVFATKEITFKEA